MYSSGFYSRGSMEMNDNCTSCGFQFEIQPGFFWGAMFFNYAFVVALFTIQTLALKWLGLMDTYWLYVVSPVSVVILLPVIIRFSRILFLHLFGGIVFEG